MAITHIGSQGAAATTVTIPAHQIGDLILIFAYRDGSNTVPTVPTAGGTVPTWTQIGSSGGNTNSSRLHYAVATATNTTSGTWTSATELICAVYRGTKLPGASQGAGTTGTSISYPAITALQRTNNTSWVAGFAGHRTATNVELNPSGMTNRTSSGTEAANHDTNGTVSSWSAQNVTVNASSGWRSWVVELRDGALSLTADVGAFTHTGVDAGLSKGFSLTADPGAFTWTGIDADLIYVQLKQIIADLGAFAWTGVDADVRHTALITADTRSYAWTGIDATPRPARRLVADVGSFTVTGINNAFARTRVLAGEAGSYVVTGINANTLRAVLLSPSTRQYLVTGLDAILNYSGGGPPPSTVKKLKYSFGLEELHQIRIGEALDNGGLIYRAGGIYRIL